MLLNYNLTDQINSARYQTGSSMINFVYIITRFDSTVS